MGKNVIGTVTVRVFPLVVTLNPTPEIMQLVLPDCGLLLLVWPLPGVMAGCVHWRLLPSLFIKFNTGGLRGIYM